MFGGLLINGKRKTGLEKLIEFKPRKTKKRKARRSLTNKKKIRIRERRGK